LTKPQIYDKICNEIKKEGSELEIAIVAVIAAAILLILGVGAVSLLMLLLYAALAVTVLMSVFFAVSLIMLLLSKKCRGSFVRFEKRGRFETAVYEIGGEEYENRYPAETFLRSRIYAPGERTLFLCGAKKRFVFDIHTVTIILWGITLSVFGVILTAETLGIMRAFS
jgi:hypothetical protein